VKKLRGQVADLLLFLKSVLSIRVSRIRPDGRIEDLLTATTVNREQVEAARQCLRSKLSTDYKTLLKRLHDATDEDTVWEWTHVVEVAGSGIETRRESWEVVHGLFRDNNGALVEAATTMFHFGEKAVPLAGAAAPTLAKDAQPSVGKLYCGLPLPASSYVPFHVHGFFDLQSDRQGIFADRGAEGKDAARVRWNELLLSYACAEAGARLLQRLDAAEASRCAVSYARWPRIQEDAQALVQELPKHIYVRLIDQPCIAAGADATRRLPTDVRRIPKGKSSVRAALLAEGVPIANPELPSRIIKGFEAAGQPLVMLSAGDVRDYFRVEADPACRPEESSRPGLRQREWIVELLRFCVADEDFDDLRGVPFRAYRRRMCARVRPQVGRARVPCERRSTGAVCDPLRVVHR
jgi:hypothetical protein